jgi:hypothetical protein
MNPHLNCMVLALALATAASASDTRSKTRSGFDRKIDRVCIVVLDSTWGADSSYLAAIKQGFEHQFRMRNVQHAAVVLETPGKSEPRGASDSIRPGMDAEPGRPSARLSMSDPRLEASALRRQIAFEPEYVLRVSLSDTTRFYTSRKAFRDVICFQAALIASPGTTVWTAETYAPESISNAQDIMEISRQLVEQIQMDGLVASPGTAKP